MKKFLAVTVMFFFFCMVIFPSSGIQINKNIIITSDRGNTLYVGGSGSGNYTKIQDAIDDAIDGDTVFVYSGTYYEFLRIEKTINLIGEDPDTTSIIFYSQYSAPIMIDIPDVVINGFTLYNPNPEHVRYIGIYPNNNNTSISNCIFYNSPLHFDDDTVGIGIYNSSYNKISNCTFMYNDDEGICLNVGSSHNIVENCVFTGCCVGIEFQNSSHNIVDNCIMKDGTHNGISIVYHDLTSNNNIITNCNIYDNEHFGIYLKDGYNNIIYNCTFENNLGCGIWVSGEYSCNNLIVNNKISNSTDCSWGGGLALGSSCHNNTFSNNHISNCNNGVYIEDTYNTDDCNDNLFYHNNFIDNNRGAFDECDNIWDKGYPIGGNYWSDYTGVDNDEDGIGDTPYDISGPEDNKDYYPLMEPWITDELTVETSGPYYGLINEPIKFHGFAVGGYKPYSWHWDLGDGNTSDEQNPNHTYTEAGKYDVVFTVTDNSSNSTCDTTFAWIQTSNSPPVLEFIDCPTNGTIGTSYDYTFKAVDPEGASVWFIINWGDSSDTGWLGPYNSGKEVTLSHIWYKQGIYTIKGKAKDPYDDEGPWGELKVTMPRDKSISNSPLLRFLERYPLLNLLFQRFLC